MNSKLGWVGAVILISALFAGLYATTPEQINGERDVTIETCEALPDYNFEKIVTRVERIKGAELERNLSICVEQTTDGIDTTPNEGQFARVEEPGLSLFDLDATKHSQQRSSLGHMSFSPSGGPIEIFLANERVVQNVSWISYEGVVAHEVSDAIEVPEDIPERTASTERASRPQTTDEILAQQAFTNGISTYVADLYVERYGGHLNVSSLNTDYRNWKHRLVQSLYYRGYRYSEQTDQRTIPEEDRPNSTAQLLRPNETVRVTGFPSRPNLSIDSLEHYRTDRIGELFLQEVLESKGVSSERATGATDGWTNDRMDYYRTNGSTVVTWRVTWENEDEKEEFVEVYDTVYDYERVDALTSISCRESNRYLTTSENSLTVVACSVR